MATKSVLKPAYILGRISASRCVWITSQTRSQLNQCRSQSTLTPPTPENFPPPALPSSSPPLTNSATSPSSSACVAPLSPVPTGHLLRNLMITSVTSAPAFSDFLSKQLNKHSTFLSENPVTSTALRYSFYNHFCAGRNQDEIKATYDMLRNLGLDGVSLAYAKEMEETDGPETPEQTKSHIHEWKQGTLKTIEYSVPGDYVSVKYTGAGSRVCQSFEDGSPLPTSYHHALDEICAAARTKSIRILFDAEHARQQDALDNLTMDLMAKYNRGDLSPIVYNTYQMYLKSSPATLQKHLKLAKEGSFVFAAKLVRGAYLHSDPRHLIHDTKADTDKSYDAAVELLMTKKDQTVGLVIATHNRESCDHARKLLAESEYKGDLAFAQLMGMADEISMDLVARNNTLPEGQRKVNVIKYLPWGSVEECVKYLLRRADENKDALARTAESRDACWKEICRRGGIGKETTA